MAEHIEVVFAGELHLRHIRGELAGQVEPFHRGQPHLRELFLLHSVTPPMRRSLCRAAGKLACPGDKPGAADIEWNEVMRMRWRYAPAAALLAVMAVVLARSEETAQAVRDGLALCAQSVVPALFPFFVLSGLFISMGCAGVLAPALGRLPGVSPAGASAFLLGAVGGYPVGARTVGQLRAAGLCGREEGECLLTCCNNAGPAFIFGVAGLGCFGSLRAGAALYAIHIGSAALVGLLHRRRGGSSAGALPAAIRMRPSQALIDAVQSAAGAMVQVCAFVVFFLTALRLLTGLTGWSPPALLGFFELTNGILRLPPTRAGFVWAAALLGWGGLSVHCQTAAVLRGAGLSLRPYLRGKALQAALSAATAAFTAQWIL